MKQVPAVEQLYSQYMEELGHRCADELKLETLTYHHDPSPLFVQHCGIARWRRKGPTSRGGQ